MKDANTPEKLPKDKKGKEFITVGIGASAGGIEALKDFFANMPAKPDMAFVVILHLSPKHESILAAILQKETKMAVTQVNGTVKVVPNHVYVIPPNKNLAMVDGVIKLTPPEKGRGTRVAIDLFFRTLAKAHGRNAVGIVLSGTGSDGTIGLKQVKENNGFAIVQDPKQAEFDSMPRSAIATDLVDWILPTNEMAGKLITFRKSSETLNLTEHEEVAPSGIKGADDIREILTLIRVRTGHDFSYYKQPTLLRRIARHMQIHELEDMSQYLELLRERPGDMQSLIKNLLINVTNFFRDKEVFEALERDVIPRLFEGKTSKDTVRAWSAACASGEEAFSIAILLAERASLMNNPPKIQVFATDVDEDAIIEARENHYPETIEADVSPERLSRFFVRDGDHYRVRKDLRENVLFAPHNILRDPPFSRLDLVACRNLLIYLNRETQERVLRIFHFALKPTGHLLLGNSESAEGLPTLYSPEDRKNRIYLRHSAPNEQRSAPVLPVTGEWRIKMAKGAKGLEQDRNVSFGEMHYKLVEEYAPPSVLVNEDFEIVHLSESAGRYLRFTGGTPSNSLLKALHPDLLADARAALFAARDGNKSEFKDIRLTLDGKEILLNLIVRPVEVVEAGRNFLLIVFDENPVFPRSHKIEGSPETTSTIAGDDAMESVVRRLETDLRRTKTQLRLTTEQHEIAIEELKASNEELQAINEELRSATEELETSKEELQSVNEELTTVNQELKEKVEEANRINTDLQNLMASTDVGAIFIDRSLEVKRYTPSIEGLFNIIPGDIGRPLEHITHRLDYKTLADDAAEVLRTLKSREIEACDDRDRCYMVRMMPYRTADDKVEGVVLTFIDITTRLKAENRLRWLGTVVESSNDAIFSFAFDQKIVSWNAGAEKIFGYMAEEAIGHSLAMLTQDGRQNEQQELLTKTWGGEIVENFETVQMHKGGTPIDISLTLAPIMDENQKVAGMSATVRDITRRKQADETLRDVEERQRLLIESAEDYAIFTMTSDGIVDSWNTGAERVFGFTEEEIIGESCSILFTPEDREQGVPQLEMETAAKKGRAEDERYHIRKDGTRFYASGVMTALMDGGLHGFAKIARDLTASKKAEEELHRVQENLENRVVERTAELAESNESLRLEMGQRERSEEARVGLLRKIVTTQEEERSRIARDIHDHLGQRLTALRLKIAALTEVGVGKDELVRRVERLQEIGSQLDSEVSFLAWELRPAVLDDLGLLAAAGNYVNEWSRHFAIPADFHSTGLKNKRLDPEIETNLYRILQEALNNAYKHAKATQANVLLERRQKEVVLIVEDNGTGFDPETFDKVERSGRGLGLIGIRERAAIINGTVEIESAPGHGTTIFVKVPFIPMAEQGNNGE